MSELTILKAKANSFISKVQDKLIKVIDAYSSTKVECINASDEVFADGEVRYNVHIIGCDPSAAFFIEALREYLVNCGYNNITVRAEW